MTSYQRTLIKGALAQGRITAAFEVLMQVIDQQQKVIDEQQKEINKLKEAAKWEGPYV